MTNHNLTPDTMWFFYLAVVSLLLTCYSTNAYEDDKGIVLDPCNGKSHQIIYITPDNHNSPANITISLANGDCGKIYKLSLVIVKKESTFNKCEEGESLAVLYKTETGEISKNGWGCYTKSNKHNGDQYMYVDVDHLIDNALEISIGREGNWTNTVAFLVATAYFESPDCGKDYFNCNDKKGCPNNPDVNRCISYSLKCDNLPSCGMPCNSDEANEVCHPELYSINWKDFQYIVTTFLAALFFILSPTVIVFLLFYRKRMRTQEQQQRLRLEREIRAARERSMITTISNRVNDNPPTYDVIHETIEPPPCFCAAVALSNAINKDKAAEAEASTEISTDAEIKFDCTCNV